MPSTPEPDAGHGLRLVSHQKRPLKAEKQAFDSDSLLAIASKGSTLADYPKNHQVFSQGDPADAIFHVKKGKLKLTEHGKEAVVAILGVGDFFGQGCLASQSLRTASAATMSECSIMRLEKEGVIRLLQDEPAFSELLLHHMLSRNIRIEEESGGPALQLQRKAASAGSPSVGQLREGWESRVCYPKD